jgi:spore maturation protein CgeB
VTREFDIVILGLSVTSSWGNGHATTYRGLIRGLAERGHRVLFLERDAPWYAGNRDCPQPRGARTELYTSLEELRTRFESAVSTAKLVIVGSFVPEGVAVGEWVTAIASGVTAFYDIDTPLTLEALERGSGEYITRDLVKRYRLYLSFTGGPVLRRLESEFGAQIARPLYCSVDPDLYRPVQAGIQWDLGYLGTYSDDRQPALDAMLLEPARCWPPGRFSVVGPMYPKTLQWPRNVAREIHLSPREHPGFYAAQRFTLNVTRQAMKRTGFSPSVRLFEAGACGVPIISDWWPGLDSLFEIGREVLLSSGAEDTLRILRDYPEAQRLQLADAARRSILAAHTPLQRAAQLEGYWKEADDNVSSHPTRGNRRAGDDSCGPKSGLDSESAGSGAGATPRGQIGQPSAGGHIHESAGARS